MPFLLGAFAAFPPAIRPALFGTCALVTQLPMLAYLLWGLATGRGAWAELVILLLAGLAGLAIAVKAVEALPSLLDSKSETAPRLTPMLRDISATAARLYARMKRAATAAQADRDDIAALEDGLTGLANRRGFLAQLDALPPGRRQGCVALVDVDHFGEINILLGHQAGDRILHDLAARLSSQIRRVDIVARWGGQEFALFYPDAIEDEASWSLARIADGLRREPVGEISGQPVSFSAGLSRWRGGPVHAALAQAEEALQRAKLSGRSQIQRAERGPSLHLI